MTGGFSGYSSVSKSFAAGGDNPNEYNGSTMMFAQTSAPIGWTKETSINDTAVRVVSGSIGTGGSADFSTVFTTLTPTGSVTGLSGTVGSVALSTDQIPSHSHPHQYATIRYSASVGSIARGQFLNGTTVANPSFTGTAHAHPTAVTGISFSSTLNMNLRYQDVIFATKDSV